MEEFRDQIRILAIESSCDDTAAAVMINGQVKSNVISSQLVHSEFGGVVPELASRQHQKHISVVVEKALKKAGILLQDLTAIAYTQGPGLLGSLMVGAHYAKGLAISLGLPILGVDHLHAHVMCHLIDQPRPKFPFNCLLVSGGHTHIIKVDDPFTLTTIGKTLDDAAGEAFDKTAKMLGLGYPGGPLIDKLAHQGDSQKFQFPKSKVPDFNYSFSGLKTAIMSFLQKHHTQDPDFIMKELPHICASVQFTIVDYLMSVFEKSCKNLGINEVALAGGVSANSELRSKFERLAERGYTCHIPAFEYCTDNAAMIAIVGHYFFQAKRFSDVSEPLYTRSQWL